MRRITEVTLLVLGYNESKLTKVPMGTSSAVFHLRRTGHIRTVSAAVEMAVGLYAVSDNLDAAVLATRGEGMNRALEAIERM